MNSSTLPPLLGNYHPSYEEKTSNSTSRNVENSKVGGIKEEETVITFGAGEVEKTSKSSRAIQTQRRLMEAEEKASKEREEKALHTLRMWNVVKEHEKKRKQKLLRDRVDLQHEMIKKQDQLNEILEKQKKPNKDLPQNSHSQHQKLKLTAGGSSKLVHPEPHKHQHKARKTQTKAKKRKSKGVEELSIVRTILKDGEDEERSEISHKDAFSEEDLTEFMENSTMEDSDFRLLRHQPLNVQLEKLFGEKAESYLNPTLEESPRKIPNGALVKKKGCHGATALWETLRDFSRQKLRNKDALILPDVKNAYACFARECLRRHVTPVKRNFVSEEETPVNVNIEESDLLKDVRYRRHRQELMFRIAHVNKEKTKLLFQALGPPYYVDTKTQEGLRRYYPHVMKEDHVLPSIVVEEKSRPRSAHVSTVLNNEQPKLVKSADPHAEKQTRVSGDKLVFLTEEKALCKGQFAKRLGKQDGNEEMNTDLRKTKSVGSIGRSTAKKPEFLQRLWEPLSMDALLEHRESFFERRNNIFAQDPSRTWNVPT